MIIGYHNLMMKGVLDKQIIHPNSLLVIMLIGFAEAQD